MSGLYNLMHGVNPLAGELLGVLELSPADFGRFRDAYLVDGDDGLLINVHTRCGGGNRGDYQDVFKAVRQHPHYVRDQDCEFDSTYADILFKVPEKWKKGLMTLIEMADKEGVRDRLVDNRGQKKKWDEALATMATTPEGETR